MTTTYPADLPQVPSHRWGAHYITTINVDHGDDMNHPHIVWGVLADSQEEAERRTLAVQRHTFEDPLEDARAEATWSAEDGEWIVTIFLAPYR